MEIFSIVLRFTQLNILRWQSYIYFANCMFVNNNYFYRLLIIILAVLSYSQNKLLKFPTYK